MKRIENIDSPIVVGAVGGSGTRVVAQILMELGYYMGYDFNTAYDNLLFTRLFRNPELIFSENNSEIEKRLHIYQDLMCSNEVSISLLKELISISKQNQYYKPKLISNLKFYKNTLFRNCTENWGWKAPNSMIYMEYLANLFPKMKYIHVIRHGLDMAFSNNTQQLHLWNKLFDIEIPINKEDLPKAQLEYWIKSNQYVIDKGKSLLKSNFYILKYDDLIHNPEVEINKLLNFLEIKRENTNFTNLISFIKKTESVERYKKHDISIFSEKQLQEIRNFGFNF